MLAPQRLVGLLLVILAGMTSPPAHAQFGAPADMAEKAVNEFCIPVVLRGGDAAAIADELGIEQDYRVPTRVAAWASRTEGDYYRYPTRDGLLLLVVNSGKKQLSCDVALFETSYAVGERTYRQIDAIFKRRHYRTIKGLPQHNAKAYKGDRMLIIIIGPQLRAGAGDPVTHVTMKRRLYAF